jgi:hypothetical protein
MTVTAIFRRIPMVRSELVADCHHPPQEECPRETRRLILDFLA